MQDISRIRRHRNEVAHELPRLLSQSDLDLNLDYFVRIRELLQKIETWWIVNFDIPIDPDLANVEIEPEDIRPGRVIVLDYLISVVLSDTYRRTSKTYAFVFWR